MAQVPQGRDTVGPRQIVWGAIVLIVPPLVLFVRDRHAPLDWALIRTTLLLYGFVLAIYVLTNALRIPKKLDDDRNEREAALRNDGANTESLLKSDITERDQVIQQRNEFIRALAEKPKRTAAEQHDYDTAKKALQMAGEKGLSALRHIRRQGTLTFAFGGSSGPLPPGMNLNDTLWVYSHCASEGLLTSSQKIGSGEKTFAVAPKMEKILDELLYDGS